MTDKLQQKISKPRSQPKNPKNLGILNGKNKTTETEKSTNEQKTLITEIKANQEIIDELRQISHQENKKNSKILNETSIDNIKGNILLTNNKEQSISNLKEETSKRIRAYTSITKDNWLELNYQKFKNDKTGKSHEMNIGLGDILLNPLIKTITVKRKNGEIINGHRCIDPKRGVYFVDNKNNYLATYTGDSFKISKKGNEENKKKEIELLITLKYKARKKSIEYIQKEKISEKDRIAIHALTEEEKQDKQINTSTVKYAEQLSRKKIKIKKPEDLEVHNKPLSILISKTCKHFGVPQSLMYATFKTESNFKHKAYGDKHLKGGSLGIGQFRPATFNTVSKTKAFKNYMRIHYPDKAQPFKRGENILADITATAIFLKQIANKGNINLTEPLSIQDIIYIRAGYNAGPGNAEKYKNQYISGKTSKNLEHYKQFAKLTIRYASTGLNL